MRGGDPFSKLWSDITIDAAKNMGGYALSNLGDVTIGANNIVTTNIKLRELNASWLGIRNLLNTAYLSMMAEDFYPQVAISYQTIAGIFKTAGVNGAVVALQAYKSGVAQAEIARLVGAAVPYLQATLPLRFLPIATASLPATPVEGMTTYDDTLKKITYRDNTAWRTLEGITIVRKTADELVNNSTVLQDDNHLVLPLAANETWLVDLTLIYDSHADDDIKINFTMPAGCVAITNGWYIDPAGAFQTAQFVGVAYSLLGNGVGNKLFMKFTYHVINGANAGNFQLQWAQNTAGLHDTTVFANSTLIARKIA